MGLIDRDYMHERRAERAFAPQASATSTLFKVLECMASLFLLYKIADWQLGKRAIGLTAQALQQVRPSPIQPPLQPEVSPRVRETGAPMYQHAPEPAAGTRVVTKCIVNGKTSYGDGPCASGAVTTQVATRADHNLMAPVRIQSTTTTQTTFSPAPLVVAQNDALPDYAATKSECQMLDAHIKHLDSMSRQPQDAPTMDRIRDERKNARDRQFRIPCQ